MIFFDNWRQKIHKFQQGETPVSMSKLSWVSLLPPLPRCHQIRSSTVTRPPPWPRRPPRRSAARGWWQQRNINININSCIQFIETLNCNPSGWLTAASVVTYLGFASAAGCVSPSAWCSSITCHCIARSVQLFKLHCTDNCYRYLQYTG